jgi:broad specificity phosphatase PhoE
MQSIDTTTVDVLRHGQTCGGKAYYGRTDVALSEIGLQQMFASPTFLQSYDLIVSSPLIRCLKFAKIMANKYQLPLYSEAGFEELDFGDWEGKTADQISQQQGTALIDFYDDPIKYPATGGEHFTDFHHRVATAWKTLLKHHQGQRVLLISHAGVIRMLFSLILEIPFKNTFRIQVGHASYSRFQYHSGSEGGTCHLLFHGKNSDYNSRARK